MTQVISIHNNDKYKTFIIVDKNKINSILTLTE